MNSFNKSPLDHPGSCPICTGHPLNHTWEAQHMFTTQKLTLHPFHHLKNTGVNISKWHPYLSSLRSVIMYYIGLRSFEEIQVC